jgi:hypothetical protein
MAKANIKIEGLEALQLKLLARLDSARNVLNQRLKELAEKAIIYSKDHKGYKDQTSNLKNSISFALYYDGELITKFVGKIPKAKAHPKGQAQVEQALETYAKKIDVENTKGYVVTIVAGMDYAKYVEDKGYNVLYLTKYFIQDDMKLIIDELKELFIK